MNNNTLKTVASTDENQVQESNVLTCVNTGKWSSPCTVKNIKKAITGRNAELYAIDTTGKLALGSNYISEELKHEIILDIEAVGMDYVLFMTTNSIFRTQPIYSTLGHARYCLEKLYEGPVRRMHAGSQHVFINTPNGYLVGGHNNYFQFGMPTPPPVADVFFIPATNVNELGTIDKLVTGGWHAYAQRDKTFYGWGCNSDGRLGNNTSHHQETPTKINFFEDYGIVRIACGGWHSIGLTARGDVLIWGVSVDNSLGIESWHNVTVPTMLICDQGVTNIFCGSYGACSLVQTKDGRMLGWGKKTKNTFGDTELDYRKPVAIPELNRLKLGIVYISYDGIVITLETQKEFVIKNRDKFTDVSIVF